MQIRSELNNRLKGWRNLLTVIPGVLTVEMMSIEYEIK